MAQFLKQIETNFSNHKQSKKSHPTEPGNKCLERNSGIFTPRCWAEKFRQFAKRELKIDIATLLKGENVTETRWTRKKNTENTIKFYFGSGSVLPLSILEKERSLRSRDLLSCPFCKKLLGY